MGPAGCGYRHSFVFHSSFWHREGGELSEPAFSGAQIEAPISDIVQRSCASCHSDQTIWPSYSYLPPASWMVEKDVHDGRDHFNMSHWDGYSAEKRIEILSLIAVMVRNKQTRLPWYTWLHPDAKLSDADMRLIDRWSHGERRRLRAQAASLEGQEGR